MEAWLLEQLPKFIAGLIATGGLGMAWRLGLGSRLGTFLRWLGGEIRTQIYLRKELMDARYEIQRHEKQTVIREAHVTFLEDQIADLNRTVEALMQRMGLSSDSLSGSESLPSIESATTDQKTMK